MQIFTRNICLFEIIFKILQTVKEIIYFFNFFMNYALIAFYKTFFSIYINKYNISTNLLNIAAAYDIFLIATKNAPDLARARYYNVCNMACTYIKFNITNISKPCAVSAIYNFLFTQF